jgi:adenylate cyclase
VGSTAFAEKFGDLRTQQFFGSIFGAFAEEVRIHRGSIDDYIGDAAIITWTMKRGLKNAACVRCVFSILDRFKSNADTWMREFGCVPQLRVAIHGGHIVTAEIGVDHRKITYFGDTINTTARLEGLGKTLNRGVLISADLAGRLIMPLELKLEPLGEYDLKGRGQKLGVIALERVKQNGAIA